MPNTFVHTPLTCVPGSCVRVFPPHELSCVVPHSRATCRVTMVGMVPLGGAVHSPQS